MDWWVDWFRPTERLLRNLETHQLVDAEEQNDNRGDQQPGLWLLCQTRIKLLCMLLDRFEHEHIVGAEPGSMKRTNPRPAPTGKAPVLPLTYVARLEHFESRHHQPNLSTRILTTPARVVEGVRQLERLPRVQNHHFKPPLAEPNHGAPIIAECIVSNRADNDFGAWLHMHS